LPPSRCTMARLHGMNHVFVIGPGELNDVEPAVVIVVAEEAGRTHDEIGHAGFDADLCKGTVAIVAEQLRASQARAEEQVRVAVVVVVAPRRAEGGEDRVQAGGFGYVGEGSVSVVVKKPGRNTAIEEPAEVVGDEQVEVAVAVVIHPGSGKARTPATHAGMRATYRVAAG